MQRFYPLYSYLHPLWAGRGGGTGLNSSGALKKYASAKN